MLLHVLGQTFAALDALFQFCMGDVAAHDDRTVEQEEGRYRILGQIGQNFLHWTVQVDAHTVGMLGETVAEVGLLSRVSSQIPSLLILPLMLRSALQDTPRPTGQEAP